MRSSRPAPGAAGGSSRSTALSTCADCRPNARRPDSISYSTAPKLKTSERASSGLPSRLLRRHVGRRAETVPCRVRVRVGVGVDAVWPGRSRGAWPLPSRVTRIFAGFQIAMQDAVARARLRARSAICSASRSASSGGSGPSQRRALDVLEHQVVRADVVDLADVRMIQRRDRARFLLESLGVLPFSRLMATMRLSRVSRALIDFAHAARANGGRISYGPSRVPGTRLTLYRPRAHIESPASATWRDPRTGPSETRRRRALPSRHRSDDRESTVRRR